MYELEATPDSPRRGQPRDEVLSPASNDRVQKKSSGLGAFSSIFNLLNLNQSASRLVDPHEHAPFADNFYEIRRKVFRFLGGGFDFKNADGEKTLYGDQENLKLHEKIHIYDRKDKKTRQEIIKIKQVNESGIDAWGEFMIHDPLHDNVPLGKLKRHFLKSFFKDKWTFHTPDGSRQIAELTESSWRRAFFSRLSGGIVPQKYIITAADGTRVAEIKQHFNPFILKYDMHILQNDPVIDKRLLVSMQLLLASVERRQTSPSSGSSSSSSSSSGNGN